MSVANDAPVVEVEDVLLEVEDLAVEFRTPDGVVPAVDGLSYTVSAGRTLAIVGESGCGKSVSSLAVMGMLGPTARVTRGAVRFRGTELLALPPKERRAYDGEHVAMVFQDALAALEPGAHGRLSAHRGTAGAARHRPRRGPPAGDRTARHGQGARAADRIKDYPHEFSGGMRQRVMIAAALALDPEVLIADEPTTALDVTVQAQIMRLLAEIQATRDGARAHHPRPRRRRLGRRRRHRDVRRSCRRTGGRARDLRRAGAPVHPGAAARGAAPDGRGAPSDKDHGGRLAVIPGRPPRPGEIRTGCPFHPRGDAVLDICRTTTPPLVVLRGGRSSRCHVATEILEAGLLEAGHG